MGWNWGHMNWWGMGWAWVIVALLLIGVVVLVVVMVTRTTTGRGPLQEPQAGRSRALEILDERYARGEIDSTEYEERRRALGGGNPI